MSLLSLDFLWSSTKEFFSLKPLYDEALKQKWNVRFLRVRRNIFRNYFTLNNLSSILVISHDTPLKRVKKIGWEGKYIYVEHGLGAIKYWTYKYPFFHNAELLFYPGKVFKRKMEAINPKFRNGLIGGYPKMDILYKTKINRESLCEKYGLNPRNPIILFAPTWGGKYNNECGIHNLKYLKNVENVISIPHPADYKMAKRYNSIIPQKADGINNFLHLADLVISDVSSVLAEASFLDKPVIQLKLKRYPGCFPEKDKRKDQSWIDEEILIKENQLADLNKRPFKIPFIDEDWVMGHICKPKELINTIPLALREKDKFKDARRYWTKQSGWKFDGKICYRILYMIKEFLIKGERIQIEDIQ